MSLENDDDMNVHLPVIDISNVDAQTADKLLQAATKWGFVYLSIQGLGISPEEIEQAFDLV